MHKAKLTFSNGEILILNESQLLVPIIKYTNGDDVSASVDKSYEIWNHIHNGLIPSITEFLFRSDYFHLLDNPDKIYNSSSVVTIENI